jgi:hypothetical protein
LTNNCNTRVWLHQNVDGSGNALCIDPANVYNPTFMNANPDFDWTRESGHYSQIWISANQAPCSSG